MHRLELAETVSVLTGAGISAASGVPTFRGEGGLWKNYRPEELATPHAFQRDPVLVWEWYSWRRDLIRNVKPNEAHFALAAMEKIIPNFVIITQNVDNLHQDAGNKNVIELHGNIMRNKCFNCGRKLEAEIDLHNLPRCPDCHGLIRPDVVWFGESLPMRAIQDAHSCAQRSEVFLIIGTSGVVEPAAS
ncbi:MAG: NAD-dependent deacylase, partial [Calditrichaeota bacterium]